MPKSHRPYAPEFRQRFPPYTPELNPVELLWGYLKYGRLANPAPDTVDEIRPTWAVSGGARPDTRSS